MSLILTKVIVSTLASGSSYHGLSGCTTYGINPTTFLLTYGAMTMYDTYCDYIGNIKTIITSSGVTKECRVYEMDWINNVANLLPSLLCLGAKIVGSNPVIGLFSGLAAGIALETVADALNLDCTTTIVHEINSNEFIEIL